MLYIGADHGGFELKELIKQWLTERNIDYTAVGAHALNSQDDYPQFAFSVAESVSQDPEQHRGIVLCRSAAGVIIAANKVKNIRAIAPVTIEAAILSKEHNNTNIIGISGDWMTLDVAKNIIHEWLQATFSEEERHRRRVHQIQLYEDQHIY